MTVGPPVRLDLPDYYDVPVRILHLSDGRQPDGEIGHCRCCGRRILGDHETKTPIDLAIFHTKDEALFERARRGLAEGHIACAPEESNPALRDRWAKAIARVRRDDAAQADVGREVPGVEGDGW